MTTPRPWHVPSLPTPSCICRKASPRSSSAKSSCAPRAADGNSYNTGDAVNAIDWDRTTQYADSVDYVKGLIKLRKQINALRLTELQRHQRQRDDAQVR